MKISKVTLGSIYLDRGEGIDYLKQQVTRMAKQNPSEYFFDVLCRPDQVQEAVKIVSEFYKLTDELIPTLGNDKKFISISCDDNVRPATAMLAILTKDQKIGFFDLNPSRKPR